VKRKFRPLSLLNTAAIYFYTLVIIAPLLLTISNAFKNDRDSLSLPPKFLFTPTLSALKAAIQGGYLDSLRNSLVIVLTSTFLAIVLAVPAAFGLAFFKYKRSKQTIFWILSTAFMPSVGVVIPIYLVLNHLGLLDTRLAMILIYTSMSLPLSVLILRSFYLDIPREIVEAARVDGTTTRQLFLYIAVPLSIPGITTAAVLAIIFAWNEFLFALMLTSTNSATLPIFIVSSVTSMSTNLSSFSAASLLAALPIVILGWTAQKALVEGLTMGAVK
jgi:sorbitol/mannitol transport system permease protein